MLKAIRKLLEPKVRPWDSYLSQCLECAEGLLKKREYDRAVYMLKDCIKQSPDYAKPHFVLGMALEYSGEKELACEAYNAYLDRDSGDTLGAGIRLFLLKGENHPATLPKAYVTNLFDDFAPTFDKNLTAIKYRAPELLGVEMLTAHTDRFGRILDLGCGTGLSGLPYKDHADIIEGVDISSSMLEKAREKNVYAHLYNADLHDFLKMHENMYDAIISADVLIYVGALEDIMKEVSGALKPGSLFGFTVQHMKEGDFLLGKDQRYWHSTSYLERCMRDAGLGVVLTRPITLRKEHYEPVPGLVVLGRRKT